MSDKKIKEEYQKYKQNEIKASKACARTRLGSQNNQIKYEDWLHAFIQRFLFEDKHRKCLDISRRRGNEECKYRIEPRIVSKNDKLFQKNQPDILTEYKRQRSVKLSKILTKK